MSVRKQSVDYPYCSSVTPFFLAVYQAHLTVATGRAFLAMAAGTQASSWHSLTRVCLMPTPAASPPAAFEDTSNTLKKLKWNSLTWDAAPMLSSHCLVCQCFSLFLPCYPGAQGTSAWCGSAVPTTYKPPDCHWQCSHWYELHTASPQRDLQCSSMVCSYSSNTGII